MNRYPENEYNYTRDMSITGKPIRMFKETIGIIHMYFLILRYYALSTKTIKHTTKMAKYINSHKEKLNTQKGREVLNIIHKICIEQQRANNAGSRH